MPNCSSPAIMNAPVFSKPCQLCVLSSTGMAFRPTWKVASECLSYGHRSLSFLLWIFLSAPTSLFLLRYWSSCWFVGAVVQAAHFLSVCFHFFLLLFYFVYAVLWKFSSLVKLSISIVTSMASEFWNMVRKAISLLSLYENSSHFF